MGKNTKRILGVNREKMLSLLGLKLNEKGQEIPDPKPVEIPVGFKKPDSIQDMIRRLVHNEFAVQKRGDVESFQEADDFDVDDDFDSIDRGTLYERDFDLALVQSVDKGITAVPKSPDFKEERPVLWKGTPPKEKVDKASPGPKESLLDAKTEKAEAKGE